MRTLFIAIPLALLLAFPVGASIGLTKNDKTTVVVLDALTSAPDKGTPQELVPKVDCILIFPSLTRSAFIVGGKGGYGVSCRQPDGKMGSAPFYTVGGASIGFQVGGRAADVVMLIMNENGVEHLLTDRFTINGEATATGRPGAAHGPTGDRDAEARVDPLLVSFARPLRTAKHQPTGRASMEGRPVEPAPLPRGIGAGNGRDAQGRHGDPMSRS